MKNLCNSCKFAKWNTSSVENASCEQVPAYKVTELGNYVTECSSYQTNNVIRCFINFIKKT